MSVSSQTIDSTAHQALNKKVSVVGISQRSSQYVAYSMEL